MTKSLNARDIINYTEDEIWMLPNTSFEVKFDDGTIETTGRRLIYCWYMWEIHRQYPATPLKVSHSMKMDRLSGDTHLDVLGEINRDWHFTHKDNPSADPEKVWKLIYEIINFMYNDLIQKLDEYVETVNALDFLEVIDHPKIKEANDKVKPTQSSIDQNYETILDVMNNAPELKYNSFANLVRTKIPSNQQVVQMVGARGFVTEVNSMIKPVPVLRGFIKGLRSLYDHMLDSRSAAKALFFSKDPLQTTEYFNRKLQLLCQVIKPLAQGDCGSTYTMSWTVEASELKSLIGMYYLEDGELKTIPKDNSHLIGKTLNLRTPFGCIHEDRQTICETCYGEMSHSIPRGTYIGHAAAVALCEKISQLVLSVKHVDGSSKVEKIDLGEGSENYLVTSSDGNSLKLSPELKDQHVRIGIEIKYAQNLSDIYNVKDEFENIDRSLITQIKSVTFMVGDPDDEEHQIHEARIPTSMGSRDSSLTAKALHYIVQNGIRVDDSNTYILDLKNWNHDDLLFELPLKHLNMVDYQKQVEKMLLAEDDNKTIIKSLSSYPTTVEAVKSLLSLINTKVNVNLSHVLTIAYATAAVDPENGNFHLPRGGESFRFTKILTLMPGRDLGAMMAFERQKEIFDLVDPFIIKDRPSHPAAELLKG